MNDPLDIPLIEYSKTEEYEFQKINTSDIRICSFSKESNHLLMWAHYAESFQGICIGYRLLKLPENIGWDLISYSSEKNDFSRLSRETGLLDAGLYTKHISWEYEKEVRLLIYKSNTKKIKYSYPIKIQDNKSIEGYISEITVGYKFSNSQLTILKSIVEQLNKERKKYFLHPIRIYRTKLDEKYPFRLKKEICI